MSKILFNGLVVNMLSPMDKKLRVDGESISRLLDHFNRNGIGGVWALGSAGEDINLSLEYRKNFLLEYAKRNIYEMPTIIGVGNSSFDEILEFSSLAYENGFDGVHCLLYDQKLGDSVAKDYLIRIADSIQLPLWLYHNPKRGKPLTYNMIKDLSYHRNIKGIKVGGYDLQFITSIVSLQSDEFQVMAAGGGQLFQSLCLGTNAHSSSDANVWPQKLKEIFDTFQNGNFNESKELQFKHIDFTSQFPKTENGERAAEEKFKCNLLGLCQEYVNASYRYYTHEEKEKVIELMNANELI